MSYSEAEKERFRLNLEEAFPYSGETTVRLVSRLATQANEDLSLELDCDSLSQRLNDAPQNCQTLGEKWNWFINEEIGTREAYLGQSFDREYYNVP